MHVLAYTPDGFLLIRAVHNVLSKVWMSVRIVKAAEAQAPLQTDARKASMNRTQCAARLIQIAVSSLAQEKNIGTFAVLLFHERRPFLRLSDAVFCGMLRRLDRHDGQRFLLGIGEEEVDRRRLFPRALDLRVHEEVLTQSPSRLRTVHQDVAAARLSKEVGRHLDDAAVPIFFPQGGKLLRSLAVLLAPRQKGAAFERLLVEFQEFQRIRIAFLAARRQKALIERSRRKTFLVARRQP